MHRSATSLDEGVVSDGDRGSELRRRGFKRAATLKLLPSRIASRAYGAVNRITLPRPARSAVYSAWAWAFGVKRDEIPLPLSEYPTLTAFFTRRLRHGARIVHPRAPLVSPVDAKVIAVSRDLEQVGFLAQVKGIQYHVRDFLGIDSPPLAPGHALHSCVLYLSPADYHRFHSPCRWTVTSRTHFAGQLLPVNPAVVRILPSLFCVNERVAVFGKWEHGFMSYTAVGATNVGSIRIAFDPDVRTNASEHDWDMGFAPLETLGWGDCREDEAERAQPPTTGHGTRRCSSASADGIVSSTDEDVPSHSPHLKPRLVQQRTYDPPVELDRGDEVGLFELGSTVVLIFAAPEDFRFTVKAGDRVTVGEPIGTLSPGDADPMPGQGTPITADPLEIIGPSMRDRVTLDGESDDAEQCQPRERRPMSIDTAADMPWSDAEAVTETDISACEIDSESMGSFDEFSACGAHKAAKPFKVDSYHPEADRASRRVQTPASHPFILVNHANPAAAASHAMRGRAGSRSGLPKAAMDRRAASAGPLRGRTSLRSAPLPAPVAITSAATGATVPAATCRDITINHGEVLDALMRVASAAASGLLPSDVLPAAVVDHLASLHRVRSFDAGVDIEQEQLVAGKPKEASKKSEQRARSQRKVQARPRGLTDASSVGDLSDWASCYGDDETADVSEMQC